MRHGYGVRKSAQHGVAAKFRSRSRTNASLTSLRSEYGEEDEKDEKKIGLFFFSFALSSVVKKLAEIS